MSQTFRKLLQFGCVIAIGVVVAGCASIGDFRGQTTTTDVRLTENNYKIVKVGASGDSTGFHKIKGHGFILGLSRPSAAPKLHPPPDPFRRHGE